ncbi:hybrid sensor histidine kinase/response regulator [Pseudodonghicola flavimaris]|uniref:histidine kinase n=1 Tax=Pseudodonghicola flavimaris TaxID=3050036 RepID=A0ABT7F8A1_9RHOB|nr:histidine kinase N-terminal 7TM domain-containing protein [Pseudodonghicola flavimaris]MDK3020836.1 histidine kinase N-terminal 7TM domain-containing protein [Pseudodonghicola flavimaris]
MTCLTSLEFTLGSATAVALWVICALILAWVARNNRFAGKPAFVLTLSAMLWWLFTVAFDLASQGEACKVGWSLAAWPGITLLPIAWSFFIFDYTMNTGSGPKPVRRLFYIGLPCAVAAIALTNSQTHLLYGTDTRLVDQGGHAFVIFDHGPLFFAVAAGLYIFVTSALSVLVVAFFRARKIIRPFLGVLFVITAAPLAANLGYVGWGFTFFDFDPTPFMFAIALIALSWLLLNNTMMDTAAQGRNLLFYATRDPVIILDGDGRFAGANPAARALFRTTLPRHGEAPERLEAIGPILKDFIATGALPRDEPIRLAERVFDLRALPIESPIQSSHPLLGWSVSLVDITERERTAEALRAALAQAEEANRAKSHFLANVSHEIRTPLNGILGMASVLGETALDAEQSDYLKVIEESGQVLLSTIGDVLDLSKIEAGKMVLETRPFVLRDAIEGARALFSASAREKGLGLRVKVDDALPEVILGDDHRFRQVLHNLVSNAVKFTMAGEVTISAEAAEAGATLLVRVIDTGPGVPVEARRAIFLPFQQADAGDTRKFGGTGLGLSISRQLCHLMGGSLQLAADTGRGACFEIRLPLVAADAPEADSASAPFSDAASDLPGMDVLVVDDNKTNRLILEKFLAGTPCRVRTASSGPEAIEMVADLRFDAILMDIQMPEMGGVEATQKIRALEAATGRQPSFIVAVTANAMPEQLEQYLTADMNEVLSKPVSKAKLLALMERVHRQAC